MHYSAALRVTLAVICSCCALSAQTKSPAVIPPPAQTSTPATTKKKPPKKKLTPEQEHGLRLLKNAEAMAAGLEPPTRTYVLWQVSHGYRKVDPDKADAVLRRAFSASRAIQDQPVSDDCHMEPVCHVRWWLQREILEDLLRPSSGKSSPERVEKLLPQADAEVKKQMLQQLASEYIRKPDLDRARQLLDQMEDDNYSYDVAGELMAALPVSRREERLAIFSQAFRNYQNRTLEDLDPSDNDDFGILVIRFWRDVPSLALDAVDTILERSQRSRSEQENAHRLDNALER